MTKNSLLTGAFVPTTYIWDIQALQETDADPQLIELLVRMYQNLNQIALVLNIKDTGMYQTSEFVTGEQLFPNPNNNSSTAASPAQRQIRRKVVVFPMLPNATVAMQPHRIICTPTTSFIEISGAASDPTDFLYRPLPYVDTAGLDSISVSLDDKYVYITTQTNLTAYTFVYVVLRWVQT